LGKSARNWIVPELESTVLPIVDNCPVANTRLLSGMSASTGRLALAIAARTVGRSVSGMLKMTEIGCSCTTEMMPGPVLWAWIRLPGSTRRKPTRPSSGDFSTVQLRLMLASSIEAWSAATTPVRRFTVDTCLSNCWREAKARTVSAL